MMTRSPDAQARVAQTDGDGGDPVPHLGVGPARPAVRRLPAQRLLRGVARDAPMDDLDHAPRNSSGAAASASPRTTVMSAPRPPASGVVTGTRGAAAAQARTQRRRREVERQAQRDGRRSRQQEHEPEFGVQAQGRVMTIAATSTVTGWWMT